MIVTGSQHTGVSHHEKTRLKQSVPRALLRALRAVQAYAPVGPAPPVNHVGTWFGQLSHAHHQTLVQNIRLMHQCVQNYSVGGKQFERTMMYALSSGDEHHDMGQYGASWSLGVTNVNSHFYLRVYVGRAFAAQNFTDKVNTTVHELSHRILRTDDVDTSATPVGGLDVCNGECYGLNNAQALATTDPAIALTNAENYGYFVAEFV